MSLIRVQVTAPVQLTHTWYVDESPTDAGAVTVAVKRLDGTPIAGSPFATSSPSTGVNVFTLPSLPDVDTLTADWTGSLGTARDYVELVGGFLFSLVEARQGPPPIPSTFTPARLAAKRTEVEVECELITKVALVPRFKRYTLSGNGTPRLLTPDCALRRLRAVSVAGTAWSTDAVDAVEVIDSGVLIRPGGTAWPCGNSNIVIEIEHGLDFVPPTIPTAAKGRLRTLLEPGNTGVPSNALSYSTPDGGSYRLSIPNIERTGVPWIDAIYQRSRQELGGFA